MNDTYLYIRYSHEKQEDGSSRQRQLNMALDYFPGLIQDSDHIYFDPGKSAYKGEQLAEGGQLKRFRDDVHSRKVPTGSRLLVEDLDRLSRADMWQASEFLREMLAEGITIVTLKDRKVYKGALTISDSILTLIHQEQNHLESAKKAGRVARSYVIRYAEARAGKKVQVLLPSWLKWTSSETPYEVKEDEEKIVKEIFRQAAAGESYAAIAKDLNDRRVRPFRAKHKPGALWITASLFALIKNRAVLGEYAPRDGGPPIPGYFPAIVDQETFDAANGARAERKRDRVTSSSDWRVNLWSKVGVCGICKRSLFSLPKGKAGHVYLVCSGKLGGECKATNIRADRSELAFREVVLNAVNADYFTGDQRRQDESELRQLEGKIDAVQKRKDRLVALLSSDEDTEPLEEVATAIRQAKAELGTLQQAQASIQERVAVETGIERSRAALMAKINLDDKKSRMEANALLRGLKVKTEIVRHDDQINYTVMQDGRKTLVVYDRSGEMLALPYSQDAGERMYERGETPEPYYNITLSDAVKAGKARRGE